MNNTDSFMQITGCTDRELARRFITQCGGRLDVAIDTYYNQQPSSSLFNSTTTTNNNNNNTKTIDPLVIPRLEQIFEHYAERSDMNKMDIDGTVAYFSDMNIDVENDVEAIIAAYTLESPSTGVFTRGAFVRNWAKLNISTLDGMSSYLQQAKRDTKVMDEVHKFAFQYALEPGERKLAVEDAVALWRVLYGEDLRDSQSTVSLFVNDFVGSGASGRRVVSRDEWGMSRGFFRLRREELARLSGAAAWPLLMDEFADFLFGRS